jgi:hypothetical protein
MNSDLQPVVIRQLGLTDYAKTLERMRSFTEQRSAATCDELQPRVESRSDTGG